MIMTDNNDGDVDEELVIDRSHIECDWCGKPGPTKNCSGCMSYYYCNRECQLNHWKNHKQLCLALKDEYNIYKGKERREKEFLAFSDKEKEECAICLEEIELPISLECGHVFCVSCLCQYQTRNLGKGNCPNCRGGIEKELGEKMAEQTSVYIERAKRSHGAERDAYVNLALRQVDASINNQSLFEDQEYKDMLQLGTLMRKAFTLGELNMPREAIETVDEFMNLCVSTDHDVKEEWILDTRIFKAQAYLGLEEWQTALDLFMLLKEDCKEHRRRFCYAITTGICRAQYELQNYQEASEKGCWMLESYRCCAGVHKYIALSQMKLGDIAKAKKTITQGILLEEQWNEENRKENEEVLRMILAEETENTKSKTKKKGKKKRRGRRNRIVEE